MNLHIIHKSASQQASATDALALIAADDAVIFIDDGIYNAIANSDYVQPFIGSAKHCYVIEAHAQARGIEKLDPHIQLIDMEKFVALSLAAKHNISWY